MPGAGPGCPGLLDREGHGSIRASVPSGAGPVDHLTGHHLAFCSSGTDAVGAEVGPVNPGVRKSLTGKTGPRVGGGADPAIPEVTRGLSSFL